jgi:cell division protein FtsQ
MSTRLHIIFLRMAITGLVTAGALMLLSAVKTKETKPCSKVKVQYKNGVSSGFVPEKEVYATISQILQAEPVGAAIGGFDLNDIEVQLEKHPWVYDAQLYFDNNQILHVILDEAIPVARVMDVGGSSFYVDKFGRELPVSQHYRMDLPVFTGVQHKRSGGAGLKDIQKICMLAMVIAKDSFWMAQAAQIEILPDGKMEMIPALGNHVVDLGDAGNPEEMLNKLKHFYMAMAAAGRLNDYSRIHAGYKGQIVAQRAQYVVANSDGKEAMITYQKIVSENKQVVNATSVVKETGAGRLMGESPEVKVVPEKTEGKTERKQEMDKGVKPAEVIPEKTVQKKEQRIPKAIMPKTENN